MNREHVTKLRWLTSSPVPKAEKTPLNQKKDAPALRQRKPIGDLSNLINFDTLAAALKYIPNDLPYDEFIKMTAALKSACAGSESFYPIYEEWALQWPDNTPESVREKWDSIHDTSAGAGTIFHYAQKRGWVPPDGITPPWVLEMNEHYFVVKDAGKTVIYSEEWDPIAERQRLVPSSFEDIRNLHKNEKVLVGEKNVPRGHAWIDHAKRRTYHGGIVFAPNKMVKPDQYNLWRGYGVEAQKGQWELMRKHIRYVICDGDETKFRYLLGWMANAIQHPDEPGRVAIVLQGGQGTGKGFFAKYFGKLFGQHTIHVSCADHVTGRFNGHLRDAVLVFVDEAFFAGDKQIKNKMKALITEETLMLEDKYMKAQSIPNHMHFIIASNERHVMNVEADDRRHFILQVSDKVKNDRAYFAALRQEMENGGPEAMLFDLLEMDLAEFDVTTAPKTEALLEQKIKSLYGPPAWLHNCLYMGEMAGQSWDERGVIIPRISAHKDYTDKHRQVGDLRTSRDQSEFGAEVHKIFGNALKEKRLTQGLQRVWCHAFPPLSEARRLFEHFIGGKISWPHDDNIDPLT